MLVKHLFYIFVVLTFKTPDETIYSTVCIVIERKKENFSHFLFLRFCMRVAFCYHIILIHFINQPIFFFRFYFENFPRFFFFFLYLWYRSQTLDVTTAFNKSQVYIHVSLVLIERFKFCICIVSFII